MPGKIKQIIQNNFFRPGWYSVLINPYFIARRGLHKQIKDFSSSQDFSGRKILDVGCGQKPYQSLFSGAEQYFGIDIEGGGHYDGAKTVDKFYDGQHIPLADASFDYVICTQVLEHAANPTLLLGEIARVLKPGGQLFLTMPFVWSEHEIPFDFRRFTRYEHARLLKASGLEMVTIQDTTGFFRTIGQLSSAFIFEGLSRHLPLRHAFQPLIALMICAPIQIGAILLDWIFPNRGLTLDYAVRARK